MSYEHRKISRHPEGEESPLHVLTEADVIDMRRMRRYDRMPYYHIGSEFGVTASTAWLAIHGETWRCVTEEPPLKVRRPRRS